MRASADGIQGLFAQVSRALCRLLVRDARVMLLVESTSDKMIEDIFDI
jgi:hypothetical protein